MSEHPNYPTLSDPEEIYQRGYRAGVEAMRDACKKEGSYWFTYYENHFDEIAARLLEEK